MSRLYLVLLLLISGSVFSQDFTNKYYEHALKQRDIGDYVEAIEYFKKVLEVDSNSVDVLWNYAEVLRLYKDYREAERLYKKVYEKEESRIHLRSIFYLGEMQKSNGKYEDAIETFKLAKKKYASDKEEYLYQKSVQELESCLWAKKTVRDSSEIELVKLPPLINTPDSEFGHTLLNSTLFYSSLKGDTTKSNEEVLGSEYRTAIFKTEIQNPKTIEKQNDISSAQLHVGNGNFSIDKKRYYYTVCKEIDSKLQCKIVMAYYVNGNMRSIDTLNEIINEEDANTTMPFITKFDGQEVLFFASDRSGSKGGLDIFYSYITGAGESYSKPLPVENINTKDNEITPFFDTLTQKLYFSSSWHNGFGAYDIFSSDFRNYKFEKPINLGVPINSPANDLYFFREKDHYFLSTNRIGVTFSRNPTCCSDIYTYSPLTREREIDTNYLENNTSSILYKSEFKSLDDLNKKLPVTLYFHNDVPNPKSIDTNTNLNYLTTYEEYTNLIPQYKKEYAKGLAGEKANDAEEDIESFFIEYVNQGVKDLEVFRELLLKELKENKSIVLTVKGFASPLAKSDYNVNLTKRRISSLENYLKEYDNGVFLPYLEQKNPTGTKLIIQEVPFGEYVANKLVSDNPNDMRNSVYSRVAGLERKIEIQSVSYLKGDSANYLAAKTQLIDLGTIDASKLYSRKFVVKNIGVNPLKISNIDIPCVCNTVEISKKELKTNETSIVTLNFDPKGYSGKIVKSVYIYTENSNSSLRLVLTGEIK